MPACKFLTNIRSILTLTSKKCELLEMFYFPIGRVIQKVGRLGKYSTERSAKN